MIIGQLTLQDNNFYFLYLMSFYLLYHVNDLEFDSGFSSRPVGGDGVTHDSSRFRE